MDRPEWCLVVSRPLLAVVSRCLLNGSTAFLDLPGQFLSCFSLISLTAAGYCDAAASTPKGAAEAGQYDWALNSHAGMLMVASILCLSKAAELRQCSPRYSGRFPVDRFAVVLRCFDLVRPTAP